MDRGLNISLAVGQGVKMMAKMETPSEKNGKSTFIPATRICTDRQPTNDTAQSTG